MEKRIVLAWTGASGIDYGSYLLRGLRQAGRQVHLIISRAAHRVMEHEAPGAEEQIQTAFARYNEEDICAPPASGSWGHAGMVICPCSMASLAAIATGTGQNLIHRAADVTLKERRPLILVPRETPLNRVHLTNMLAAHEAGACIFPPTPGFYTRPAGLADLFWHTASRIMDQLGIDNAHAPRWGE